MAMRRGMVDPGVSPPLLRRGYKSELNIAHSFLRPASSKHVAIFLPQFFGSFPSSSPGGALFGGFNNVQGPKTGPATGQGDLRWKLRAAGSGYVRSSSIF